MWSDILIAVLALGLNIEMAVRVWRKSSDAEFCKSYRTFSKCERIGMVSLTVTFGIIIFALALVLLTALIAMFVLYYIVFLKGFKGIFKLLSKDQLVELIQISLADLKRDRKEMENEGRGFWFIKTLILGKITATIVPIVLDGTLRIVKTVLPFAKYFKG